MPKATLAREVDKKFNHTNNVNKKLIKKKRTRPTKFNKPKKPRKTRSKVIRDKNGNISEILNQEED